MTATRKWRNSVRATRYFHKALRYPLNGKPFVRHIAQLGAVKLYIYRHEDAPNCWAMMRTPRILVNTKNSQILRGYAAVLLVDDDEGNQYLSAMEGPAHDEWNPDRARNWTKAQKSEGARILKESRKFVRDTLKELRGEYASEEEDIPDLSKYLPFDDEDPDEGQNGVAGVNRTGTTTEQETGGRRSRDHSGVVEVRPSKRRRQSPLTPDEGLTDETGTGGGDEPDDVELELNDDGNGGGRGDGGGDNGAESGEGDGAQSEGADTEPILRRAQVDMRSICTASDRYTVVLHAKEDVGGVLGLLANGDDRRFKVRLLSATSNAGQPHTVAGNKIQGISMNRGDTLRLEVTIVTSMNPAGVKLSLGMGG